MANRSYLYVVDEIPTLEHKPEFRVLGDWSWDVPIAFNVLLTGNPRAVPSTVWEEEQILAILGDFDDGVANFERFLAALPATAAVTEWAAQARAALHDPGIAGRYLVLEVWEIVELSAESNEQGEVGEPEIATAFTEILARVGDVDSWVARAPGLLERDHEQATGGGHLTPIGFYAPAVTPAGIAPLTPAQPSPSPSPPLLPPVNPYGPVPQPYPGPPQGTGNLAWGLGLLVLVPFPMVSAIGAALAMVFVGLAQGKHGALARINGRHAANWGLTYLLLTVLALTGHFVLLYQLTKDAPATTFFPVGIPITLWVLISVMHVVFCLVGQSRASQGRIAKLPAIRFFRA